MISKLFEKGVSNPTEEVVTPEKRSLEERNVLPKELQPGFETKTNFPKELTPEVDLPDIPEGNGREEGIFPKELTPAASDCLDSNLSTKDSEESKDYDVNGLRELTEDEKADLMEKLGWSYDKISQKCTIDKNGVIHYKCRIEKNNQSGIEYASKIITINGVKIEGVFPKFDSKFDTKLSPEDYSSSSCKQFSECNKKLKAAIEKDPELRSQFTKEQLEDIENGNTPRGYTWHHNEEPGKMQLVKTADHDQCIGGAPHTGGNSLWGNKAIDKQEEGVSF